MADADWNDDDVANGDQTVLSDNPAIEIAYNSDIHDHEDLFDDAPTEDDLSEHCSDESDLLAVLDAVDDAEIEIHALPDVQDTRNATESNPEDLAALGAAIEQLSESYPSEEEDASSLSQKLSELHTESEGSITESQETASRSSDASEQDDEKETEMAEAAPNANSRLSSPIPNVGAVFQHAATLASADSRRMDPVAQVNCHLTITADGTRARRP